MIRICSSKDLSRDSSFGAVEIFTEIFFADSENGLLLFNNFVKHQCQLKIRQQKT